MPLVTVNWSGQEQTGSALPPDKLPANARAEVSNAIGQLQVDDIFGEQGPTGVQDVYGWRIDRQNSPGDYVNLSVQRNRERAPSTVATVFVPGALNIAPPQGGPFAPSFALRIAELLRAVRRGLEESFATYVVVPDGAQITRRRVDGKFSN